MNEEIEITIEKNGDVSVEGKNIAGADCVKLTAEIEKALGVVTATKKKSEYFQSPKVLRKVHG